MFSYEDIFALRELRQGLLSALLLFNKYLEWVW